MKKIGKAIFALVLFLISTAYLTNALLNANQKTFKIANWNLQIFGDSKAGNPELMDKYVSTIKKYDIIFLQEIRDKDGSAFEELCKLLPEYNCMISSRAGRTAIKEQYGIVYKKEIEILKFKDFNPDAQNRWERPPIEVIFNISGYELRAYNIHVDPDAVYKELNELEKIAIGLDNAVILGDLNADCSYYDESKKGFSQWVWMIKDEEDTTVGKSECAYDRILASKEAMEEFAGYGIYKEEIDEKVSDHYLVWAEFKIEEQK